MAGPPITHELLESDKAGYQKATQSPFLAAAALGKVPKDILGQWLANDRMYIHNYIRGTGRLLATHSLPLTAAESAESSLVKFIDWVVEALVNVRREESFFIDTARRYNLVIDLPAGSDGDMGVSEAHTLEGLRLFEDLFSECAHHTSGALPWWEDAIVFWATEKCYLDAWSWSKSQVPKTDSGDGAESDDADGGALRREFIPNWSSPEFAIFVDKLGSIIDEAADRQVRLLGPDARSDLFKRAETKWREVLAAEQSFWPQM